MLSIIIIIILILIIILLLNSIKKYKKTQPNIIKNNNIINSRGIYAVRNYNINEIIEICPTLSFNISYIDLYYNELNNYLFKKDNTTCLLGLGQCSLYNHSDNNNATQVVKENNMIVIYAIKNIKKNDEIFISYGDNYWKDKVKINI